MQSAPSQSTFDPDLELLIFNHYHCPNALTIYYDKQKSPFFSNFLLFFLLYFPFEINKIYSRSFVVGKTFDVPG